jgi:two-component system nitrogen regulation response regulator NtrX
MARKILVVDDDPGIRDALKMILEYEGYEVLSAPDGKTALGDLDSTRVDGVLLDIKMPGMDGFEILDRIVAREDAPPVLMISGHGDIATAVEATRRGAVDFLEKPPQRERILVSIANALSRNTLRAENERLRQKLEEESVLVGKSAPMVRLREEVARAAPTSATVLVTGESGTGKELVARALHFGGPRASGPWVALNCAAIPAQLF